MYVCILSRIDYADCYAVTRRLLVVSCNSTLLCPQLSLLQLHSARQNGESKVKEGLDSLLKRATSTSDVPLLLRRLHVAV